MIPDDDILGAKLIDFGVASDTVDSKKSIIGDTFAGKISYASPEQLGIGSAKVAAASDLYSTGLVLMRVAGLKVPGAGGKLVDAIDARRADVIVSGENVSSSLAKVLNALLRADPKARPTEPLGFVNKVLTSTTTKKVEAYNEPLNKNGVKNSSKPAPFKDDVPTEESSTNIGTSRSVIFVLASVVVLAVVSGAGFWNYKSNSQNEAEGTAIELLRFI